ncbi:MAG: HDIG domain-containing protein, partial [Candidatus Methanomethylophilaceae archaeon]|nr:HDIG domain-containing protein [Candidatus Methanomethylophilaceae archaeon]
MIIHCCTVRTVAEEMMKRIDCDRDLVIAGAMLHDLGRAKDHSILHAMIGAD